MSKKVQFALFSPQAGQTWHQLEDRAHRCEKLGYHSIWLVDHMWTRGMPDLPHHECLTLMAGLAAKTEKIRIGTLVICNSYRNPALLAKSLVTIDHISNGRLEFEAPRERPSRIPCPVGSRGFAIAHFDSRLNKEPPRRCEPLQMAFVALECISDTSNIRALRRTSLVFSITYPVFGCGGRI